MAKKKEAPKKRVYGSGSLYLAGETYYASIIHKGKRIRKSLGVKSEKEALVELAKLQGRSVRNEISIPGDLTMEALLKARLVSMKRNLDNGIGSTGMFATQKGQVESHLVPYFGTLKPSEVTAKHISSYRKMRELQNSQQGKNRRKTTKQTEKLVKDSTINREVALLRKAMRDLAREDPDSLPSLPFFKMGPESPPRTGFITPKHFWEKFFPNLPFYLKAISVGAFFWGGRKSEWTALDYDEVDLSIDAVSKEPTGYIHFDETKNQVERDVPILPGKMYEALVHQKEWHDTVCPDEPAFFLNHDGTGRLKDFEKAWDTARKAAGHPGLLFHDMRRSANRNMRDEGLVQAVRMQMTGQKTPSMDLRYGIVDKENIEDARKKMAPSSRS